MTISILRREVERELSLVTRGNQGLASVAADALRYSVLTKGHRWRPILFLALIEAGGGNHEKYLSAAAGLELIHNSTLIIDDLPFVDNATLRRNRPCCHTRFGVDVALYASHLGFDLGELLILNNAPDESRQRLQEGIKTLKARLIAGQCIERAFSMHQLPITLGNLKKQYLFKSGAFFKFLFQLAGGFCGIDQRNFQSLAKLGEEVGIAYQIADDIDDISGEPSAMGKQTDMDVGKANYPRYGGKRFAVTELNKYHRRTMTAIESLFRNNVLTRNKTSLVAILYKLYHRY